MSWTTLRTWVTGEVITAAELNAQIRDNLGTVTGASTAFGTAATVWTASGTNPAIGNGTYAGYFRQDNKWVDVFYSITMGSTTTYGTGTWTLALPVTARFSPGGIEGRAFDNSASGPYDIMGDASTTLIALRCQATSAGANNRVVSSANPFTWAVNDTLQVSLRYEAA